MALPFMVNFFAFELEPEPALLKLLNALLIEPNVVAVGWEMVFSNDTFLVRLREARPV